MKVYTYQEIRDKILKDCDLEEETFIQADEMVGYFNEAIDNAEAEILGTFEDYFLTKANIALIQGQADYSLPTDCYATKIRNLVYRNGAVVYEILPIRRLKKFARIETDLAFNSADDYVYWIKNTDATTGFKIVLDPPSRETSSTNVTIYYIRNANRIPLISEGTLAATLATKVDIPEFYTYLIKFVKVKIAGKEGDPRYDDLVNEMVDEKQRMVETLKKMVIDDNDTVDMDLSFYEVHS